MCKQLIIACLLLLLAGCAAGPAAVQTEPAAEAGLVRFEFTTAGKNDFTVGGHTCEALKGGGCVLEVPTADLQGGWNEIEVETRRRTGEKEKLKSVFFLGDEAFARDCTVTESSESGDPAELEFALACAFEEGFHGELFGEPMQGGRASVRAVDVPRDPEVAGGVTQPLARAQLPLVVVNRAGGQWPRPVDVVVPLPLVQLAIEGARPTWYEPVLPLRLRVETGAQVFVDGREVGPPGRDGVIKAEVAIDPGPNTVTIEARLHGRVPTVHELAIRGSAPDTPLYIDEPLRDDFTTIDRVLVVRGVTSPQARLYVGSRPVDIPADGSFELQVPLIEGYNEVEVMAVVDPSPGVRRRPPTKRTFQVQCTPRPRLEMEQFLSSAPQDEIDEALAGLGEDPWVFLGRRVRFALVVEDVATSLGDGGCAARIAGLACTKEVSRPVLVGFERRLARACIGHELPAVVELDSCPELAAGDRLDVVGTIQGGLGGRHGDLTVERPRIKATWAAPSPWLLEPTGQEAP